MSRLADPACCLAVLAAVLAAAVPAAAQSSRERPFVQAVKVDTGPRVDGALDDEVWARATAVDTFTQQEPNLGQPATERTEVRIVYDARTIYIAVHAYQAGGVTAAAEAPGAGAGDHAQHTGGVVATEMRRDSDRLFDEDNFQVILDTFKDSRNGYMFVTTPLGAKLEQQIFDEGEGGGRGTTSNVNRNWDGVWDSAARITEDGWTAEMAIPTNTLRFRPTDEQTWGINFLRHIRRSNELDYWSPIPRAYALTRVSLAGELRGLQNLNLGWDLKLKPFVVAGPRRRELSAANRSTTWARDVGLDARYGVTAGLNLDVTLNTDFAQVEVDDQQVNLTRFGLFFPEKRDFFLESVQLLHDGHRRVVHLDAGADRPVLQPPHRPVRDRPAGADPGRRASHRQGGEEQHRRARRPDRQRVLAAGRQLLRQPLQPRRVAALTRRRHLHQQGVGGRQPALQPHDGRRRQLLARQQLPGELLRRQDADQPRPAVARRPADRRGRRHGLLRPRRLPRSALVRSGSTIWTCRRTSTPRPGSCSAAAATARPRPTSARRRVPRRARSR